MSIIRAQLVGDVVSGSTFAGIVTATGFDGNFNGDANVGLLTATSISIGDSTGNAGQYLQSTGVGVTWSDINFPSIGLSPSDSNVIGFNSTGERNDGANGRLPVFGSGNFQVFRSPGTFTVNPGISSIRVRVIGAGGNGGAGSPGVFPAPGPGFGAIGGGGGGGGYAHKVITSFPAPRTYNVTVGFPGGGTSSFGSEVSATGGTNASSIVNGVGGSGAGGDVNYTGAAGQNGLDVNTPFPPASPNNPLIGGGGAAATQLGNGSGVSVPGIPNLRFPPSGYSVRRFPFDIFEGHVGGATVSGFAEGQIVSLGAPSPGFEGGFGSVGLNGTLGSALPGARNGGAGGVGAGGARGGQGLAPFGPGGNGGAGGIGAGGGGGGGGAPSGGFFIPGAGGSGGPGGSGLVIVEW